MEKKCSHDLILHSVKFVHDKVIAQPLPMSTVWVRLSDTDLTTDKGYVLQNLWKDKLMPGWTDCTPIAMAPAMTGPYYKTCIHDDYIFTVNSIKFER